MLWVLELVGDGPAAFAGHVAVKCPKTGWESTGPARPARGETRAWKIADIRVKVKSYASTVRPIFMVSERRR
jgi:hypothetical protein